MVQTSGDIVECGLMCPTALDLMSFIVFPLMDNMIVYRMDPIELRLGLH
jgi:hypothetical protein